MEKEELKTILNFLGDLIDHLNLTIVTNSKNFSEEQKQSFLSVIDYYNSQFDEIDNRLTELNNFETPSWMELYNEEKHLRLTA
jgi:vacuolar-type H+-ATPase subunit C/Vma6